MDGQIIPRSVVLELAKEAARPGAQVATPWPIGTAAGQMFVRELERQQAFRAAALGAANTRAGSTLPLAT